MNIILGKRRRSQPNRQRAIWFHVIVIWSLGIICQAIMVSHALAASKNESSQEPARQESLDAATKLKVAVLWIKAKDLRKKHDWKSLAATLDEILELDPHNVEARRHAAWNLSYNMSVEPESVAERYAWVRKGILKLIEGIELDERDVRLWRDAGWYVGHKIGRDSDHQEYRQRFADDSNLHEQIAKHIALNKTLGPNGKPDNWLVAHLFGLRAVELFDSDKSTGQAQNPIVLSSGPGKYRIQYARALNEEGHFDQTAVEVWRAAEKEWRQFGDRKLPASDSTSIILNDQARLVAKIKDLWAQFDRLQPGLRDRLRKEALEAIEAYEESTNQAFNTPMTKGDDSRLFSLNELQEKTEGPNRDKAMRVARQAMDAERLLSRMKSYGGIVNYDYWLNRCRAEKSDVMLEARRLLYQAGRQLAKNNLDDNGPANPGARTLYKQAFTKWALVLKKHPRLLDDPSILDDLEDPIKCYRENVLRGKPLPDDFPLRPLVEAMEDRTD